MNLVFEHILLKEVSVVSQPAYPTQYLQALTKSYQQKENEEMAQQKDETTAENTEVVAEKNEAVASEPQNDGEAVTKDKVEETADTDTVTKAEVSPEEIAEIKEGLGHVNKAVADIADILNQMKANYANLSIGFEARRDDSGNIVDTEKSQNEQEEEAETTVEIVRKGLNEAFVLYTDQAIKPMVKMIEDLRNEVAELASAPYDKSLQVVSLDAARTPRESYERRKQVAKSSNMPFDPISAAVQSAFENRQ